MSNSRQKRTGNHPAAGPDTGTLLARARAAAGLTQKEVAERAGVSQPMIGAYETGRRQPTVPTLRRLLAAAGASLRISVDRRSGDGARAMTIAELGEAFAEGEEETSWRYLAAFLTEYGYEPRSERRALLEEAPATTGDRRFDALLGALAEHLCFHDDVPAPGWVEDEDRFLDTFWFPTNTPAAREDALMTAPASFMRRGVFITRDTLVRA